MFTLLTEALIWIISCFQYSTRHCRICSNRNKITFHDWSLERKVVAIVADNANPACGWKNKHIICYACFMLYPKANCSNSSNKNRRAAIKDTINVYLMWVFWQRKPKIIDLEVLQNKLNSYYSANCILLCFRHRQPPNPKLIWTSETI